MRRFCVTPSRLEIQPWSFATFDYWESCLWAWMALLTSSRFATIKRDLEGRFIIQIKGYILTYWSRLNWLTPDFAVSYNIIRNDWDLLGGQKIVASLSVGGELTLASSRSVYTWSAVFLICCSWLLKWDVCDGTPSNGRWCFGTIFFQLYHLMDVDEIL